MKVAILDDYLDTLRGLDCFRKLEAHEVTVFNDRVQDVDGLAGRLAGFEALVLIRERTQITAPLIERLPDLRLIRRGPADQRHQSRGAAIGTIPSTMLVH